MEQITLDPERQKKAKEYARIHRRLFVVELAWSGLYALLWLVAGWAVGLKAALLGLHVNLWLVIAAFAVIYAGIDMLLSLPLSYYSEFVLPHRYELSNETLKGWIIDNLKALLISAPIGLIVIEVIYAVLRRFPDTWWLWAAGFMLLFTVLLANLSPVLIAPIFNKYIPLGEEHQDLAERLLRLAERAHTRVRGVYKFDLSRRTKTANAALTGIGNSRRIILGDTLIEEFTPDEIETVLAHELGHHVNRDIPLIILVGSVSTLVGFYLASLSLKWGVHFWGFKDAADISALPLFILVIGVYSLVTMPLNNAFSRWRERLADQYALQATGNGEAFASAMRRLANQNLADADPEPWVEFLLYSHPALRKRIAMAETFSTS
jgi:STE24 endopeptidase